MYSVTPLHMACACCIPEVVNDLIKRGADVNRSNEVLQTPLVCAISGWDHNYDGEGFPERELRLKVIKRLLSENIGRENTIHDPLERAAGLQDEGIVALLLEESFPVTRIILESAIEYGGSEVVNIFLTHTTTALLDEEAEPLFKEMLIKYDLMSEQTKDMVVQSSAVSQHIKRNYKEMLPVAASHGRLETVPGLLPRLSTIPEEETNELLSLCLSNAATNGQADVTNFFIEEGIDPSFQRKSDGRTALHEAASGGDLEMICTLLQSCRDPRSALETNDHEGFTPWLCAIKAGDKDTLDHFMEVHPNIDLEQKTTLGLTAAHLAIE